ncbi:MAG: hypothetical protein DPW16_07040 [Chloroflexi bacterium]|nr:hypothetical protein [Chloroflexota bacterium]
MSRDYKLYLRDILAAIQNIERFTAGVDEETFSADELRLHSVLYNLMVIGEAVKSLPDEMRARVPEVPWRDIKRFRDKLVHHYFSIKTSIVWQIIQEDLATLKTAAETLLTNLEEESDGEE